MFQTNVVEKIKTHILCSITFFWKNRTVYEETWKKYGTTGQATIWRMRTACRVTEYVTLTAFPLHQWLHERAQSRLCVYCLSCLLCVFVCCRRIQVQIKYSFEKQENVYEECCMVRCDAALFGIYLHAFRRKVLLPSSV